MVLGPDERLGIMFASALAAEALGNGVNRVRSAGASIAEVGRNVVVTAGEATVDGVKGAAATMTGFTLSQGIVASALPTIQSATAVVVPGVGSFQAPIIAPLMQYAAGTLVAGPVVLGGGVVLGVTYYGVKRYRSSRTHSNSTQNENNPAAPSAELEEEQPIDDIVDLPMGVEVHIPEGHLIGEEDAPLGIAV